MQAKNHWKPWTSDEERRLVQLAEHNVPVHAIAVDLDRSVSAIRNKAKKLGVLLPLSNQRKRTLFTAPPLSHSDSPEIRGGSDRP